MNDFRAIAILEMDRTLDGPFRDIVKVQAAFLMKQCKETCWESLVQRARREVELEIVDFRSNRDEILPDGFGDAVQWGRN